MSELSQIADYVNRMLAEYEPAQTRLPISADNLVDDLHDGALLCCLANAMAGNKGEIIPVGSIKFQKATLFHKMDNVNKALDAYKNLKLQIVNVRSEFIVQKKQKSLLGLFNQLTKLRPAPDRPPKQQEIKKEEQQEQIQPITKEQETKIIPEQQEIPVQTQEQVKKIPENSEILINTNYYMNPQANNGYQFEDVFGPNVVVLCGSLRKGSFNHGIISALEQIKKGQFFDKIHFHFVDLSILPLFNEDVVAHQKIPKAVNDLKEIVLKTNAILVATPEYNGCLSPVIKNAFEWLGFDANNNPLIKKKVGVVGASYISPDAINDVRTMCESVSANCFGQYFYINLKSKAFNPETGELASQQEIDKLSLWYQDYANFALSGKDNPEPIPRFIY